MSDLSSPAAPTIFDPEMETMPRAEMRALQLERLRTQLAYVAERSAFYSELWEATGFDPHAVKSLDTFDAPVHHEGPAPGEPARRTSPRPARGGADGPGGQGARL